MTDTRTNTSGPSENRAQALMYVRGTYPLDRRASASASEQHDAGRQYLVNKTEFHAICEAERGLARIPADGDGAASRRRPGVKACPATHALTLIADDRSGSMEIVIDCQQYW